MFTLCQLSVFCLGVLFLARNVHGMDCTKKVSGFTWDFDIKIDDIVPGVQTEDDCSKLCYNDDECQGYTWLDSEVISLCKIFKHLDGLHACKDCYSGVFDRCMSKACFGVNNDVIADHFAENKVQCSKFCIEEPRCAAFTFYESSSQCLIYSQCHVQAPCDDCFTCKYNCIEDLSTTMEPITTTTKPTTSPKPTTTTTSVPLPQQCSNYMILDESDRSSSYGGCGNDGNACYCDSAVSGSHSPKWQGSGYYRLMGGAGTHLLDSAPGQYHCGTHFSGWLRETHPEQVGTEVTMTTCFDGIDSNCFYQSSIKVTNCSGYYVYYLVDISCNLRYCGA